MSTKGFVSVVVLTLAAVLAAAVSTVQFRDISTSLQTGDIVFWNCQADGVSANDVASDSLKSFSHVGMVVTLDHGVGPLLLEPVVYHHHSAAAVPRLVGAHQSAVPVHLGGATRLVSLSAHLARIASGTIAVRRLRQHATLGLDHIDEFKQLWDEISQLPEGVDLRAHGSHPELEGEFSARVIAHALQRLGLVDKARLAHLHTVQDLLQDDVTNGAYEPIQLVSSSSSDDASADSAPPSLIERLSLASQRTGLHKLHHRRKHGRQSQDQKTADAKTDQVDADSKASGSASGSDGSAESVSADDDPDTDDGSSGSSSAPRELKPNAKDAQCKVEYCDSRFHQGLLEMRVLGAEIPQSGGKLKKFFSGETEGVSVRLSQIPRFISPQYDPISDMVPLKPKSSEQERRICMCIFKPSALPVPDFSFDNVPHFLPLTPIYFNGDWAKTEKWTANIAFPSVRAVIYARRKAMKLIGITDAFGEIRWPLDTIIKTAVAEPNKQQKLPIYHLSNYTDKDVIADAHLLVSMQYHNVSGECTGQSCSIKVPDSRWEQSYPTWTADLRTGDVLIFRTHHIISSILRMALRSKVNHVATAWVDPKYGLKLMLTAESDGLVFMSLQHYLFSGQLDICLKRELHLHPLDREYTYADDGPGKKLPEGRAKYNEKLVERLALIRNAAGRHYQRFNKEFMQAGAKVYPQWVRTLLDMRSNKKADSTTLFCSETGKRYCECICSVNF